MKRYFIYLLSLLSLIAFVGVNSQSAQAKIKPIRIRVTNTAPMRTITGTRNNLTEEENLKYDTSVRNVRVNVGKIKKRQMPDFFWAPWLGAPMLVTAWDFSPNNIYVGRAYLTVKNLNRKKWYTFVGPSWDFDSPKLQHITMKPNKKGEVAYLATDFYFNYDSPIKKKKDVWFKQKQKYAPALTVFSRHGYVRKKVRTLTEYGHPTYEESDRKYLKAHHRYYFVGEMKVPHHGLCYQLYDRGGDQYWIPVKYVRLQKR